MRTPIDLSKMDWELLRKQKAWLAETALQHVSASGKKSRHPQAEGLLAFLDHLMDQAAETLGEKVYSLDVSRVGIFVWHYMTEGKRYGSVFATSHAEAARKALATETERHAEYVGTPDPHVYPNRAGYIFTHPSSATAPNIYVYVHTNWSEHIPEAKDANPR